VSIQKEEDLLSRLSNLNEEREVALNETLKQFKSDDIFTKVTDKKNVTTLTSNKTSNSTLKPSLLDTSKLTEIDTKQ
jgi:hypothetical protein